MSQELSSIPDFFQPAVEALIGSNSLSFSQSIVLESNPLGSNLLSAPNGDGKSIAISLWSLLGAVYNEKTIILVPTVEVGYRLFQYSKQALQRLKIPNISVELITGQYQRVAKTIVSPNVSDKLYSNSNESVERYIPKKSKIKYGESTNTRDREIAHKTSIPTTFEYINTRKIKIKFGKKKNKKSSLSCYEIILLFNSDYLTNTKLVDISSTKLFYVSSSSETLTHSTNNKYIKFKANICIAAISRLKSVIFKVASSISQRDILYKYLPKHKCAGVMITKLCHIDTRKDITMGEFILSLDMELYETYDFHDLAKKLLTAFYNKSSVIQTKKKPRMQNPATVMIDKDNIHNSSALINKVFPVSTISIITLGQLLNINLLSEVIGVDRIAIDEIDMLLDIYGTAASRLRRAIKPLYKQNTKTLMVSATLHAAHISICQDIVTSLSTDTLAISSENSPDHYGSSMGKKVNHFLCGIKGTTSDYINLAITYCLYLISNDKSLSANSLSIIAKASSIISSITESDKLDNGIVVAFARNRNILELADKVTRIHTFCANCLNFCETAKSVIISIYKILQLVIDKNILSRTKLIISIQLNEAVNEIMTLLRTVDIDPLNIKATKLHDEKEIFRELVKEVNNIYNGTIIHPFGKEKTTGRKIKTLVLHGKLSSKDRVAACNSLEGFNVDVLFTSDVGARGMHLPKVPFVLHLDLPFDAHTMVHRYGRINSLQEKFIDKVSNDNVLDIFSSNNSNETNSSVLSTTRQSIILTTSIPDGSFHDNIAHLDFQLRLNINMPILLNEDSISELSNSKISIDQLVHQSSLMKNSRYTQIYSNNLYTYWSSWLSKIYGLIKKNKYLSNKDDDFVSKIYAEYLQLVLTINFNFHDNCWVYSNPETGSDSSISKSQRNCLEKKADIFFEGKLFPNLMPFSKTLIREEDLTEIYRYATEENQSIGFEQLKPIEKLSISSLKSNLNHEKESKSQLIVDRNNPFTAQTNIIYHNTLNNNKVQKSDKNSTNYNLETRFSKYYSLISQFKNTLPTLWGERESTLANFSTLSYNVDTGLVKISPNTYKFREKAEIHAELISSFNKSGFW